VPRVSVIVPAYNAAGHLRVALDSVYEQSFDDWEIVVVDDGSSDDTAAVARSYDERTRVASHPTNRGLAATRNTAISLAYGELLAFLDSDDAWRPDYLRRLIGRYDAEEATRPGVGIVCCDAQLYSDDGPLNETYGARFGRPREDVDLASLLRANPIFVSALVPRRVVAEVGGFDASLRSVEDLDLWLRIIEAGYRVVYDPTPLAIYRIAPGTLSGDTLVMTRSRQAVFRAALDRGRLDPAAAAEARSGIRRERAAELIELARRAWPRHPLRAARTALMASPVVLRVIAEKAYDRGRALKRRSANQGAR